MIAIFGGEAAGETVNCVHLNLSYQRAAPPEVIYSHFCEKEKDRCHSTNEQTPVRPPHPARRRPRTRASSLLRELKAAIDLSAARETMFFVSTGTHSTSRALPASHSWRSRRPQPRVHALPRPESPYDGVCDHLQAAVSSRMGPYDAVRILRTVLASYAVVARGMRCTTGGARQEVHGDGGVRPIHLVVVAVSLHRVGAHLATRPEEARRLAEIAVAAARDYLVEFRAVRRLILSLDSAAALPAAARQRLLCTVEPPLSSPSPAGGADGFLARTGEAGTQQHAELARLVGALLRHGYAVSEAPVLGDALLAAAEEEARLLQAAGRMQPSTIKRAGSGAARHRDAAARGDVVQWLDGTDGSAPACAALTQWLRGGG